MAIRGIIFDLDGTLLDTLGDIHAAVNYAMNALDLPARDIKEVKSMIGDGAAKLIERALPKDAPACKDDALRLFSYYYERHMCVLSKPYDGICELISRLRGKINLAVLSNKPDWAVKTIVPVYFGDAFDIALGGRDGIPLKPNPKAALDIISKWGISPRETLFIGDGVQDIKTAMASKTIAIGVGWGFGDRHKLIDTGAKFICDCACEIAGLIEREQL
ncbi:MAG: HAD-IA family hydrolase [Clostridia bacterium]|nr:HAD-IA family hydrolase [Clostridia bacterium]